MLAAASSPGAAPRPKRLAAMKAETGRVIVAHSASRMMSPSATWMSPPRPRISEQVSTATLRSNCVEFHYLLILLVRRVLRSCNAASDYHGQIFTFGHGKAAATGGRDFCPGRQTALGKGRLRADNDASTWKRQVPPSVRWPGLRPAMTTSLAAGNLGMPVLDLAQSAMCWRASGGSFSTASRIALPNAACISSPRRRISAEAASAAWRSNTGARSSAFTLSRCSRMALA